MIPGQGMKIEKFLTHAPFVFSPVLKSTERKFQHDFTIYFELSCFMCTHSPSSLTWGAKIN